MKIALIALVLFFGSSSFVEAQSPLTGFMFVGIQGMISESMNPKVDLGNLFGSREVQETGDSASRQKHFVTDDLYVGPEMRSASIATDGEEHWWQYENHSRIMLLSVAGQKVGYMFSEAVCLESVVHLNDGGGYAIQMAVKF